MNDEDDKIRLNGADLIRTMVDDWAGFSDGQDFEEFFSDIGGTDGIRPNVFYRIDAELTRIEEETND